MAASNVLRSGHRVLQRVLQQTVSSGATNSNLKGFPILPSSLSSLYCRCATTDATPQEDELYRQVTVEVKGHDPAVLKSYQQFTTMAANELGVNLSRIIEPPRIITRRSLLKSVFVHKKHFHQYETRTYYKVFEFKHLTGSTASTFLEYIQRNLPEGLAMKVTKHQLHPLPSHLKPPSQSSKASANKPDASASIPSS